MINENFIKFSCNAISYKDYLRNEGLDYNILPDSPTKEDIELCKGKNLIPLCRNLEGILQVGYITEEGFTKESIPDTEEIRISFYDFKSRYLKYYGNSNNFVTIPVKLFADLIIKYALEVNASDITTYVEGDWVKTFFSARGRKIRCNIEIPLSMQRDLIYYLTNIDINQKSHDECVYADRELDLTHMGRCVVGFPEPNETTCTIRIADSSVFNLTLENLNLSREVYEFLKNKFADERGGLRLVTGKTASGKNTTILAVLKDFINEDKYKIISIESPVERKLPGVIQFNCKSQEQVRDRAHALIRENPDIVYFAEITDTIADDVLTSSNTGVRVISTLHNNSVADVLLRLRTMTGRSNEEIIQILHSVVFQRLVWDESKQCLMPKCQFVDFDSELKMELMGKPQSEMIKIIEENLHGDKDLF